MRKKPFNKVIKNILDFSVSEEKYQIISGENATVFIISNNDIVINI